MSVRESDLVDVIQRLSLSRSIGEIQGIVRIAARRFTGADGATFVLRDGDHCHYADEDAISPLWKGQRFPVQQCISGWVMTNRCPVRIPDIEHDDRIPLSIYRTTFVRSLAMVPIRTIDPVGAIGTYWAQPHIATDGELAILQALADSTAVAIENVRMLERLEDAHLDGLHRLALAAEFRDDGSHEHPVRVGRTAYALAQGLGLAEDFATWLAQAAPLHDVGKLALPDAVLLKPGRLTSGEFDLVKSHTTAGSEILAGSASRLLGLAEEIALTHHERWDGCGYPSRLEGEEIPISGRIVAVADVFDALTHVRPYKNAWSAHDAAGEIRRLAGSQFDPVVVAAFDQLEAERMVELPSWWSAATARAADPAAGPSLTG